MLQTKRNLIIAALLISPGVLGLFLSIAQPPDDGLLNYTSFLAMIFGVPFIAVIGMVVGYLTRKSKQPDKYLILGFALPAVIVCLWTLEFIQPIYRLVFGA